MVEKIPSHPQVLFLYAFRVVSYEANLSSFFDFLVVKSCSNLKYKQVGVFRLVVTELTKKRRYKKTNPVKSYFNFTVRVWVSALLSWPGGTGIVLR